MWRKKCCYSKYGKEVLKPKNPTNTGLIIGQRSADLLLVLWDNRKNVTSYNKYFIDTLPEENEILDILKDTDTFLLEIREYFNDGYPPVLHQRIKAILKIN